MKYKDDWDRAKQRFNALWNREIADRCCFSVHAPGDGADMEAYQLKKPDPHAGGEDCLAYWTDARAILTRYINKFENTFFGGEAFPLLWLNLGAAGHAGFFDGARYEFRDTVWFHPSIDDLEKKLPVYDPESFLFRTTCELAEFFCSEANGDFMVSMPDTSGNIDALAHLRGNTELLMDLASTPEAVHAALAEIQKAWEITNETVYKTVQENNQGGSSIGWLTTWAQGRHAQMQSDLSVMVSPDMFEEFVLPELRQQSAWMDYSTYHFDGIEQIRHLDMLLGLDELDMIQWTSVAGQPSPLEYIPVLKKIQDAGKIVHLSLRKEEVEPVMRELSSRGLYIRTHARSESEARELLKQVETWTHE